MGSGFEPFGLVRVLNQRDSDSLTGNYVSEVEGIPMAFRESCRFWCLIVGISVVCFWPVSGFSEELEVWWEKPAPSIEEISGGKLHVGDTITSENVEYVKDYMPEVFYLDTLDGAEWEIMPTTPGAKLIFPSMITATKENLGKAVLQGDSLYLADGTPWIGGFPFPEPKNALEVMQNRAYRNVDAIRGQVKVLWVNPGREIYKTTSADVGLMYSTGRVCEEPKPYLPGREAELVRELIWFIEPYDVRGLSILSTIYVDQDRFPDAWGYIPALRRVQRFSSAQRYDSTDGSDFRAGDFDTFSDPLGLWDFKILGRKFLFSVLTGADFQAGIAPLTETAPLIKGRYLKGARVELRDTYIIEARPKDSDYIYSKKILYIDAAIWLSWLGEFYDKSDELWIGYSLWWFRNVTDCGNYPNVTWIGINNYQTGSSSSQQISFSTRNPPLDELWPQMFTLKHIMALGR